MRQLTEDEKLRIQIAKLRGWKKIEKTKFGILIGRNPDKSRPINVLVPDYLTSRDAMEEPESSLKASETSQYCQRLFERCGSSGCAVFATARERALTYLEVKGF